MTKKHKLLIVEDDIVDQMTIQRFIDNEGLPYEYSFAGSIAEARIFLSTLAYDAVLVDYLLGDGTAIDLFDLLEDTPFVVLTGSGNENIAVDAMKSGASDYLIKDLSGRYLTIFPSTIEKAIKQKQAEEELAHYRENLEAMVAERTEALERSKARLEAEIFERVQAVEALRKLNAELDERVQKRTEQQQTLIIAMAGREVRMVELKKVIKKLRAQIRDAGMVPVADDPLFGE